MHCLGYLKPQDTLSKRSDTEVTGLIWPRQNTFDAPASKTSLSQLTRKTQDELILRFAAQTRTVLRRPQHVHIACGPQSFTTPQPLSTFTNVMLHTLRLSLARNVAAIHSVVVRSSVTISLPRTL